MGRAGPLVPSRHRTARWSPPPGFLLPGTVPGSARQSDPPTGPVGHPGPSHVGHRDSRQRPSPNRPGTCRGPRPGPLVPLAPSPRAQTARPATLAPARAESPRAPATRPRDLALAAARPDRPRHSPTCPGSAPSAWLAPPGTVGSPKCPGPARADRIRDGTGPPGTGRPGRPRAVTRARGPLYAGGAARMIPPARDPRHCQAGQASHLRRAPNGLGRPAPGHRQRSARASGHGAAACQPAPARPANSGSSGAAPPGPGPPAHAVSRGAPQVTAAGRRARAMGPSLVPKGTAAPRGGRLIPVPATRGPPPRPTRSRPAPLPGPFRPLARRMWSPRAGCPLRPPAHCRLSPRPSSQAVAKGIVGLGAWGLGLRGYRGATGARPTLPTLHGLRPRRGLLPRGSVPSEGAFSVLEVKGHLSLFN